MLNVTDNMVTGTSRYSKFVDSGKKIPLGEAHESKFIRQKYK